MSRQASLGRLAADEETSARKLEYLISVVGWWNSKRLILPFGYRFEDASMRLLRQGSGWALLTIYDRRTNTEITSEYLESGSLLTVRVRRLLRELERMIFRWEGLRFRVDRSKAPAAALLRIIGRLKAANSQKRK